MGTHYFISNRGQFRIAQKVSSPSSTISIETLERQCGERIERELERVKSQMDKKEIVSWHMPEIQQWFSDLREEKTWVCFCRSGTELITA